MSDFKKINTGDLNKAEIIGSIQMATFSAQLRLIELGFSIGDLTKIRMQIDGLVASLWALFPIIAQEPDEETIASYTLIDEQVQKQLEDIKALIKKSAYESKLND